VQRQLDDVECEIVAVSVTGEAVKATARPWSERTVLVTGGGRGIGSAYVHAFCDRGANVVIADVAADEGETLARELQAAGKRASFANVDVTDAASVAVAVEAAGGTIDVLVNNAAVYMGLARKQPFDEITQAEWDRVMAVNARGPWECAKAVAPGMCARGWGRIVNVASAVAFAGGHGFAHYVTSKAAVIGLTRALARELGGNGVTVNAVAPGLVGNDASAALNDDAGVFDRAAALRAIPRGMVADDLVGAVLFLAGDDSDFITGQVIVVDGGALMR
jgi:NAD(P)-dependent dehydrogenase (short-subunit alcohol dehydrogenase family)